MAAEKSFHPTAIKQNWLSLSLSLCYLQWLTPAATHTSCTGTFILLASRCFASSLLWISPLLVSFFWILPIKVQQNLIFKKKVFSLSFVCPFCFDLFVKNSFADPSCSLGKNMWKSLIYDTKIMPLSRRVVVGVVVVVWEFGAAKIYVSRVIGKRMRNFSFWKIVLVLKCSSVGFKTLLKQRLDHGRWEDDHRAQRGVEIDPVLNRFLSSGIGTNVLLKFHLWWFT